MPDPLAPVVGALVRDHHDAFLVELLGTGSASPERLAEMMRSGVLRAQDIGKVRIPLLDETVDPFEFMHLVSRALDSLDEEQRRAALDWGIREWTPYVLRELDRARQENRPAEPVPVSVIVERPEPPSAQGIEPEPTIWMTPSEQARHREALTRAGAYARGLGNVFASDVEQHVAEVWDGETLVRHGDESQRTSMLTTVREKTAEAVSTHRDPSRLARDLASATGYYSHNWQRIAQTEMVGAYSLGVVEVAIDRYGEQGRIVRITESGACRHCVGLFRDGEGMPRVFSVRQLLENGTNVGRRANDWQATAWPVHPNCRCDTRVVPPGAVVGRDGRFQGGGA